MVRLGVELGYLKDIERLEAENERLGSLVGDLKADRQCVARDMQAEIGRLRDAADAARQAIQYSIDMGGTDPGGVLLQAMNKCTAALGHQQTQDRQ